MAKSIIDVRGIEAFELVYHHPPKNLQDLNSALRACGLKADLVPVRPFTEYHAKPQDMAH